MEDIIDKKVIIVNGSDISNIKINIEPIKNVTSIKLVEVYATLENANEYANLKNIYVIINDYGLKTLYDNNHYKNGINVFSNISFNTHINNNVLNGTGVVCNFNLDTQNYVFNPIKGELRTLDISFKNYNKDNKELEDFKDFAFSLELCIYSKRMKMTMF